MMKCDITDKTPSLEFHCMDLHMCIYLYRPFKHKSAVRSNRYILYRIAVLQKMFFDKPEKTCWVVQIQTSLILLPSHFRTLWGSWEFIEIMEETYPQRLVNDEPAEFHHPNPHLRLKSSFMISEQ